MVSNSRRQRLQSPQPPVRLTLQEFRASTVAVAVRFGVPERLQADSRAGFQSPRAHRRRPAIELSHLSVDIDGLAREFVDSDSPAWLSNPALALKPMP